MGKRAIADVFAWMQNGHPRFAFNGSPRSLSLVFRLGSEGVDGENRSEKYPFNRRFSYYGNRDDRGVETAWMDRAFGTDHGDGGHWGDSPYPHDILHGFEKYADHALGLDEESSRVGLIPTPGYPWHGAGTAYYSARNRRWVKARKPSWMAPELITKRGGDDDGERVPTVAWCTFSPTIRCKRATNLPWLDGGAGGEKIVFTHSIDLNEDGETLEATAKAVRDCGGLLFPSLAVGTIPAPNFLPGVLVIDPSVVLDSLKGGTGAGKRGAQPLTKLYNADVWTATVSGLVTEIGPEAFKELSGQLYGDDFMETFHQHFYSSGLPTYSEFGGFRPTGARVIQSLDAMRREAAKRGKRWSRALASNRAAYNREYAEGFNEATQSVFLEAKVSAVLSLSCVRAALIPDYQANRYRNYLKAIGYRGPVIEVQTDMDTRRGIENGDLDANSGSHSRYVYAWDAVDALVRSFTPRTARTPRRR